MIKIAVLGANGQVGAELCLLLAQQAGVEVVPICRNRLGSAYLRYRGLACRHGQAADPDEAALLLGDCDIVVNLALVGTLSDPHAARVTNQALIDNIATCTRAHAKHIYFSTMSVYGDRQQGQRWALRNSYGSDKWQCEKLVRNSNARNNRPTFIFRLGHVCGELQGISRQIRRALNDGPVRLPDAQRPSNTVYVATIVDAIQKVAAGKVAPGTYDLMNVPQWSWREVFAYEAGLLNLTPRFEISAERRRMSFAQMLYTTASRLIMTAAGSVPVRRVASRLVPHLPIGMYRKVKAGYAAKAAGAEIRKLRADSMPMEAVLRAPVGRAFAQALENTAALLARPEYRIEPEQDAGIWPGDLPLFHGRDQDASTASAYEAGLKQQSGASLS